MIQKRLRSLRHVPPLRDRVIAALRLAKQPCSRGQLSNLGCLRYNLGETVMDLQAVLDALTTEKIVRRIVDPCPQIWTRASEVTWLLDKEIADFKPIRLRGQ